MELIRRAGNRGKFYPYECREIELFFKQYEITRHTTSYEEWLATFPKAIIAPHAGYVYSGPTAYAAHKALSKTASKRIIVIGPSHHHYFEGISAAFCEQYETPCGNLELDLSYLEKLNIEFRFLYHKKAHYHEHSTETQMPFIKHFNPQAKIIELIYGKVHWEEVSEIISRVLSDKNNTVVISSDLSHFHSLNQAEKLDEVCINAIRKKEIKILNKGCEACGINGITAIIDVANQLNLQSEIVDYRTSAEASGDTNSVVGYASAVFW